MEEKVVIIDELQYLVKSMGANIAICCALSKILLETMEYKESLSIKDCPHFITELENNMRILKHKQEAKITKPFKLYNIKLRNIR